MSEDMSEIFQKVNDMIKNNQIPDDIKKMMNQFGASTKQSNDMSSASQNSSNEGQESTSTNQGEMPNIDIGMMLKMKSIMDSMNKEQNDPRANLLRSLKPYLKSSRKEKVDQYIQLFRMGKVFEMMNPLGGEKKNDV